MFKIASVGGALTAALYMIFRMGKPTPVKVAQNTALEVAIFRYLTFSQGETLRERVLRAFAVKKYF